MVNKMIKGGGGGGDVEYLPTPIKLVKREEQPLKICSIYHWICSQQQCIIHVEFC